MKIGIEIDFKRGSGSIYWKSVGWRQFLRLCIAVSSLLVAGNLMADRLDASYLNKYAHHKADTNTANNTGHTTPRNRTSFTLPALPTAIKPSLVFHRSTVIRLDHGYVIARRPA